MCLINVHALLIEDKSDHVEFIVGFLKASNHIQVRTGIARNFQTARQLILKNSYDMILLDLTLPDSLFNETLKSVSAFVDDSPVVVLTSFDDSETISYYYITS